MGLELVELVIAIEETFGISIDDGAAAGLTTPALLIAHVQEAVKSRPANRVCLSQRAFHLVRTALCEVTQVPRKEIRLETRIRRLLAKEKRAEQWAAFRAEIELPSLPELKFGRGLFFFPTRVRDLVSYQIKEFSKELRTSQNWSDQEVRNVVRLLVSECLLVSSFKDEDEFIRDLGAG